MIYEYCLNCRKAITLNAAISKAEKEVIFDIMKERDETQVQWKLMRHADFYGADSFFQRNYGNGGNVS